MRNVSESAPVPLFPPDWPARFRGLALRAARCGAGPLLGLRPRKLPAGGTEQTGVRDYCPGDDLRHIDWKLCARRDEVLTRVFEGAADLHVAVLFDVSRSMGSGGGNNSSSGAPSGPKSRLARHIAAACGCWALDRLAIVSLTAFAGGLGPSVRAMRGRGNTARLLRFLAHTPLEDSPTDLLAAATAFVRLPQRRGPVVVISDLLDRRGFERPLDVLRFHGYEPIVVQVYGPADADPPRPGDVELVDCESGRRRPATITERAAVRYRQLFGRFLEQVAAACRRRTIPWFQFRADMPEEQAVRTMFGLPSACHNE